MIQQKDSLPSLKYNGIWGSIPKGSNYFCKVSSGTLPRHWPFELLVLCRPDAFVLW